MKRYLLIMLILILVLLGIVGSAFAYTTIVKDYPTLNACQGPNNTGTVPCKPGDTGFGVSEFIKYLYLLALGVVGIVGVMAIAMGAFGYVTSAGNPQAASDAKGKILSAVFGILLLLGAVVLLNMVNPDLLKLKLNTTAIPSSDSDTTANHKCLCCCYLAGQAPCTPTNPLNRIAPWGRSECKNTTIGQANSDCEKSCNTFCIDYPPGHGVSWERTLCQ